MVKNPPVSAGDTGDTVQSLGLGESLGEDMATHSSFLAWKFCGQRNLVGYTVHGVTESWTRLSN